MRKGLFLWLLALISPLTVFAQEDTTSLGAWAKRLQTFGEKIPQEEIFVHMDNTSYYLGDTLYYKAYMRLSDGRPSPLSRILYVELLNQDGYLVERQKVEMKQGHGHGSFVLLDSLYGGYYELRAYTRWQLNWGAYEHAHTRYAEDWFFNKKMAHEYYRDYDKLYSRVFPVYDKPKKAGEYDQTMTCRPLLRYFKAKEKKPKAVVSFFPEGGDLVVGTKCRVAFEANDEEGRHLKGTLTVKDRMGKVLATAETRSRGRGTFLLESVEAERLKADFAWGDSEQTFTLPSPVREGSAMQVSCDETGITVSLSNVGCAAEEPLGLTATCHGVTKWFQELGTGASLSAHIPAADLVTGVIQLTVFNPKGRIYADRLIFMNKGDIRPSNIYFEGVNDEGYEPYSPVDLTIKAELPGTISLAVRDNHNNDYTFETGNMLTEMLLGSQIKGFVEQSDYFFESNDEEHRDALDLLLMVQGWRRYNWVEMATPKAFELREPYEHTELLVGEVNHYTAVAQSNVFAEAGEQMIREAGMDADAEIREEEARLKEINTLKSLSEVETEVIGDSSKDREEAFQKSETDNGTTVKMNADLSRGRFFAKEGNLKREVLIHAEFVQPGAKKNSAVVGEMSTFNGGKFKISAPRFYEHCYFFFAASDSTKWKNEKAPMWTECGEDKNGEVVYPEFYVKLNPIYPRFVKPYSFYQENLPSGRMIGDKMVKVDDAVIMNEVQIGAKRNGTRTFDITKPAFVMDAYDAFNLVCDAGLCAGYYTGSNTFCHDVVRTFIGDMNLYRPIKLEVRMNGKNESSFISAGARESYNHLANLDKVYVYTDYSPRNEGSENYKADNQPKVTVNLQAYTDNSSRMTWRDRRMLLTGFSVCEDFYKPDYTNKPLGEPTDYRRTLYWNPDLKLDENGEANVHFFTNARQTQIIVSAEGMTPQGTPLTGIQYPQ